MSRVLNVVTFFSFVFLYKLNDKEQESYVTERKLESSAKRDFEDEQLERRTWCSHTLSDDFANPSIPETDDKNEGQLKIAGQSSGIRK